MGFHFALAAVLRAREMMEEREERCLQKILHDMAKLVDDLVRIDVQIEESEALRHREALTPCLGVHFHAAYGEVKQLKERRKDCKAKLQKLEVARNEQMAIYESARRDREMLSDMRDEKRMAYESAATKREQNILDDNYIARRGRH